MVREAMDLPLLEPLRQIALGPGALAHLAVYAPRRAGKTGFPKVHYDPPFPGDEA